LELREIALRLRALALTAARVRQHLIIDITTSRHICFFIHETRVDADDVYMVIDGQLHCHDNDPFAVMTVTSARQASLRAGGRKRCGDVPSERQNRQPTRVDVVVTSRFEIRSHR